MLLRNFTHDEEHDLERRIPPCMQQGQIAVLSARPRYRAASSVWADSLSFKEEGTATAQEEEISERCRGSGGGKPNTLVIQHGQMFFRPHHLRGGYIRCTRPIAMH